jgi:transposase
MEPEFQLTDDQWNMISEFFPDPTPNPNGGRPPVPARDCLEGVLWILRTGARWSDMPSRFPSGSTCWRRHKEWTESGVWDKVHARLLRKLDRQGKIEHEESMADAMFSAAKKGVNTLGKPNAARVPKPCCLPMGMERHWGPSSLPPVETTSV